MADRDELNRPAALQVASFVATVAYGRMALMPLFSAHALVYLATNRGVPGMVLTVVAAALAYLSQSAYTHDERGQGIIAQVLCLAFYAFSLVLLVVGW